MNKIITIKPINEKKVYNPSTNKFLDDNINVVENSYYWEKRKKENSIELVKKERKSNFFKEIKDIKEEKKENGNNV